MEASTVTMAKTNIEQFGEEEEEEEEHPPPLASQTA